MITQRTPNRQKLTKGPPQFYEAGRGVMVRTDESSGSGPVTGSLYWFMPTFGRTA